MRSAFPMKRENQFSLRAIHIDQNFLDERTHDALLESRTRGGVGPDRFPFAGGLVQVLAPGRLRLIGRPTPLLRSFFALLHMLLGHGPPPLPPPADPPPLP